jgi:hypothetical protein
MTTYTDAELEGLMLLRQAFSWKVGVEQRAGIWFAAYGVRRIRRDDPVSLFDALLLDAAARIGQYRTGDSTQADTEPQGGCTCCRELLGQLGAAIHEANSQVLAGLEAARRELAELADLIRQHKDSNSRPRLSVNGTYS